MASPSKKPQRPPVKVAREPVKAEAPPAVAAAPAQTAELFEAQAEAQAETQVETEAAPEPVAAAPATQSPEVVTPRAAAEELQQNVRAMVEKGVVETRAKYAQATSAAQAAGAAMEESYSAAREGVLALNARAMEAIKAQAGVQLDHIAKLAGAKSVSDAVALQSEFARKWFEGSTEHAKELANLARKVADDASAPIRAHVAKTFHVAR